MEPVEGRGVELFTVENISYTTIAIPVVAGLIGIAAGVAFGRRKHGPDLVSTIALRLNTFPTPNDLLNAGLDTVARRSGALGGSIHLVAGDSADALELACTWGKTAENQAPLLSSLITNQQSLHLVKANQNPEVAQVFGSDIGALLCVPLIATQYTPEGNDQTRVVGVLTMWSEKKRTSFSSDSFNLAVGISNLLSLAVTKLVAQDLAVRTSLSALSEIAELLDAKTPETEGHSRRVAILGGRLARHMNLPERTIAEIEDSARLLDIGKVAIPDSILKKQNPLTEPEFEQIKHHPLVSYEICKKLRLPESTLLLVRNHHERLDGSGYPDRLKGGEISIALRVVAAADAFIGMTSYRHHRAPLTGADALDALTRDAGTKFDAGVVDAISILLEQNKLDDLIKAPADGAHELGVMAA